MGNNSAPGNNAISTYFPGSVFSRNVITGAPSATYPANNFYPATTGAIGFIDVSGGNDRLSSTSPYRAAATDGSDVGVNMNTLNAAAGTSY